MDRYRNWSECFKFLAGKGHKNLKINGSLLDYRLSVVSMDKSLFGKSVYLDGSNRQKTEKEQIRE
jgi:hypothetical protein